MTEPLETVFDTVYGTCLKCGGPISYKTIEGPKFTPHGTFIGQIAEGLWCETCQEWQPW